MANLLTNENFEAEVLKSDIPCLVDFFAEWCGPCKMMGPVIDEIASEYEGKCKVFKLNVDDASDVAGKYGIMSIPTMMIFKGGEPIEQITGAVPKDMIKEKLDAQL